MLERPFLCSRAPSIIVVSALGMIGSLDRSSGDGLPRPKGACWRAVANKARLGGRWIRINRGPGLPLVWYGMDSDVA